ncbi:MAG: hypothetical protein ACE5HE_07905 [Phycisphaerae bacterium]
MLNTLLFENRWMLAAAWVVAQFALIAFWSWRRSRPSARGVWCGFAALPLLLVVSSLVVTTREQIIAKCEHLAGCVEAKNIREINAMLADGFEAGTLDRVAFMQLVEHRLNEWRVEDVILRRMSVTFPSPDVAVAVFLASAHIRSAEFVRDRVAGEWRVTFLSLGGTWRIGSLEPVRRGQWGYAGGVL